MKRRRALRALGRFGPPALGLVVAVVVTVGGAIVLVDFLGAWLAAFGGSSRR